VTTWGPQPMKEILLTTAFLRSSRGGRVHTSFVVSALGVGIGVAFLMLTVGIYDSYAAKLESITFSVYPHVLVFDEGGDESEPEELVPLSQEERCARICQGEVILNPEAAAEMDSRLRASQARSADLASALAGETGLRIAPLVLEDSSFEVVTGGGREEPSGRARNLRILGVEVGAGRPVPQVDLFLTPELLRALQDPGTVVVSEALARSLFQTTRVEGQTLTLIQPGGGRFHLRLAGSFALGFHSLSETMILTSLPTAQALLGLEEEVSYFGIGLDEPYRSRRILDRTRESLGQLGFRATDWTAIAGGDFESIRLFRFILLLVLGTSFVITALGIRNTLALLTLERRRQIGTLRALGLRDSSIRGIFLLIASAIALAGAVPGLLAGSLASLSFGRWLDESLAGLLPIQGVEVTFHPAAMIEILGLMLAVSTLTALLSVRRALSLDAAACLVEE